MKRFFGLFLFSVTFSFQLSSQESEGFSLSGDLEFSQNSVFYDQSSPTYSSSLGTQTFENVSVVKPSVKISPSEGVLSIWKPEISVSGTSWQSVTARLLEAYVKINLGTFGRLDFGKKQIEWGRAQYFNPVNFFQKTIDPLHPRLAVEGVPIVRASLLTENLTWEILGVPQSDYTQWGVGNRLALLKMVPQTDLSFEMYYSPSRDFCAGATIETTPLAETNILSDLNLYCELGLSRKSLLPYAAFTTGPVLKYRPLLNDLLQDGLYKELVAGIRFSFPITDTLFISEYTWLDDSMDRSQIEVFSKYGLIAQYPYELTKVSRQSLLISLWQPSFSQRWNTFTDTLAGGITSIQSLEDLSGVVTAKLESSAVENVIVGLEISYYWGDKNTLWASLPQRYSVLLSFRTAF